MRNAMLGLCLSGSLLAALPSPLHAALEYRIKADAELFRSETLDPPPLATLARGESLKLLHRGAAQSWVETEGGLKGWLRNENVVAMAAAAGGKFALGSQQVIGNGDFNVTEVLLDLKPYEAALLPLDRSFSGEIAEGLDKEQLEMRHGDN